MLDKFKYGDKVEAFIKIKGFLEEPVGKKHFYVLNLKDGASYCVHEKDIKKLEDNS
jgi:hypothetical protein